jgi:hypothetical protein
LIFYKFILIDLSIITKYFRCLNFLADFRYNLVKKHYYFDSKFIVINFIIKFKEAATAIVINFYYYSKKKIKDSYESHYCFN